MQILGKRHSQDRADGNEASPHFPIVIRRLGVVRVGKKLRDGINDRRYQGVTVRSIHKPIHEDDFSQLSGLANPGHKKRK